MNAAILNADLPISLRMKRANRRGWRIDRPDNIRFLVERAKAYRQLAAPLPWEGTFERNRAQPAGSFGDESFKLADEVMDYERDLADLMNQTPYPGIGNQIAKLEEAIADLSRLSDIRHQESMMTGFKKGELLRVTKLARELQLDGSQDLESQRILTMATGIDGRNFIIKQLAETLNLTRDDVDYYIRETRPSYVPPRTRNRRHQTPPRSPLRSPSDSSPEQVSVADGMSSDDESTLPNTYATLFRDGSGLGAVAEESALNEYGTQFV